MSACKVFRRIGRLTLAPFQLLFELTSHPLLTLRLYRVAKLLWRGKIVKLSQSTLKDLPKVPCSSLVLAAVSLSSNSDLAEEVVLALGKRRAHWQPMHNFLRVVCQHTENYPLGVRVYRRLRADSTDEEFLLSEYALLAYESGSVEAVEIIELAVKSNPDAVPLKFRLCHAYLMVNDKMAAQHVLAQIMMQFASIRKDLPRRWRFLISACKD